MTRFHLSLVYCWLLIHLGYAPLVWGQQVGESSDMQALPKVPAEFEVTLFAGEPLVRQPCSMAFDERGRLFVGMGPQYRNPKPDTPGDSVVLFLDTNGNGKADTTKLFATGLNAIQGLAWHGRDLWIANAPDLTVVRDLDGDDEADEYVKIYTDLGNLEHGLHGLNWAPDGKLYMSKGNSKGLNQPGRYAPKPFRELWGLTTPTDVPDFPSPVTFNKDNYRHAYHDPADDWGLDGGVLRCDDGGSNLEIVARGFRNPWDIAFDGGFNWIGTDNDQTKGDRVFMPFFGAHFGWNHPWSSHWGTDLHAPTAPVSGPLFEGSGTGVVFCQSPQFPPEYRGVFLVNDWLQMTTYLWRPEWDGALLRPEGGTFTPFIEGGSSLFRPTDMAFGADGALWVLGWSRGYGAEWKDGQLTNEGRIYRIAWKEAAPATYINLSADDFLQDFDSTLPVRRINAQDSLVERSADNIEMHSQLLQRLAEGKLNENQETWTVWALGRMPAATKLPDFLFSTLQANSKASLNLQIQSIRILAYRAKQFTKTKRLMDGLRLGLMHPQPRVRFATFQAIHETYRYLEDRLSLREGAIPNDSRAKRETTILVPELLTAIQNESDPTVFYSAWQALRTLLSTNELRELLSDSNAAVRRAALLGLLETHAATQQDVQPLAEKDTDPLVREVAELWFSKSGKSNPRIKGRSLHAASAGAAVEALSPIEIATIRNTQVKNGTVYKVVPSGFRQNNPVYMDRSYHLNNVPKEVEGADIIQTANEDDDSSGLKWLSMEALVPVRVWVGIDARQKKAPSWLLQDFQKEPFMATIDEGASFVFYSRAFEAGRIELGGNTDDSRSGGKGNYILAVAPLPLDKLPTKTTLDAVLPLVEHGDRDRGGFLFRHTRGASCAKCHSLDLSTNGFGPNLSSIGHRSNARHIIQSIVEPNAVITEGFNQLTVVTEEGQVTSGVLLEESGLTLSLGQSNGERVDIPIDSIEVRRKSSVSAMPDMSELLTPQQVADLTSFLLTMQAKPSFARSHSTVPSNAASEPGGFGVEEQKDRLHISFGGQPIVDFVFQDNKILRPYFANVRLANGVQVTRNHPPIAGEDAVDHDTMHPGLWLGFGDISGHDFWRNKAAMEHIRFVTPPNVKDGRLRFATECRLKTSNGDPLCLLTNKITMTPRPSGWLLSWTAKFRADQSSIFFGDQEEMGFGARVATRSTEKNGGLIRSSAGKQSAKETWGQPAAWCDYSGVDVNSGGIMLMVGPGNFRESWWHNRDYGVFVANPFGREAMKQGPKSSLEVAKGQTLQLRFGAFIHDSRRIDFASEYKLFVESK
jgi:putative membrane-bound dehydrogenase-like protein